ncbi:MAG: hypothetical protein Q8O03_03720 [Nanoarchaeota archaeon]|nr:hypothetical protein [Nanoarchaeota archaeon]
MIDKTLINKLESMAAKEKKTEPYKRKARMRGIVEEKSFTKKGNILLKIRKEDGELCFTVLKSHKERFATAESLALGRPVYAEGIKRFRGVICTKLKPLLKESDGSRQTTLA